MSTSPVLEYQRWLKDFGGTASREAVNRIAQQMRKDSDGRRSSGKGRFRGSLIGDPCDRKQVLSFLGAEQSFTELKYAVGGSWSHARWQACGLTTGWLTDIEMPVNHLRVIRGSADGMMDDGRIFELKTTRSSVLRNMKEPKEQALDQVNIYMFTAGVTQACIVYEGREDLSMREFDVELDRDRVYRLMDGTGKLHKIAKSKTLPPMHPKCTAASVMREYCSFQETCLSRWAEE